MNIETTSNTNTSSKNYNLSTPSAVRPWLASKHPKELALLDKFETELRLGRLSTSSTASAKSSIDVNSNDNSNVLEYQTASKTYGGVSASDRRLVTFRTIELLRSLIGTTKWKNAAQLMVLLRGLGRELHAAGGFREPAIGNIVRRIMCAVRQEVENADVQDNIATSAANSMGISNSKNGNDASMNMQPIDEHLSQSFSARVSISNNVGGGIVDSSAPSRSPSLVNLLWANPQHLTYNDRRKGLDRRKDSFSSVDSDPLDHIAATHEEDDFPPSFYVNRQHFRATIMEVIQEFMIDLEDLHKNINDQATSHIHAGEVVLTYGRSKTVESFLKAAAKTRQFQVIVCEGAPHFGGHRMAKSLASAGIDTTVINDSATFAIMARVNKVLLPAHAVLANGGLIAPSGCNMVALAAVKNAVPIVSITGMFKLCPMYPHEGQDTLQDFVSPSSVMDYSELSDDVMAGVELINPVHDYLAPELIGLYLTNIGAFQPSYIYRLLAEYYHSDDWES
eukprot:CAMPEP_0203666692 /NCGR_PEP_ID=MMETSP0090-20130426/3692_1 /ASSEMBLY_ACC=CAM_ASM_001088 /TAXON_ID=426623 /ORGANISM="Chaetoceros affinis, Strain CCMP159" /LENGTH=506 /DNA_ID=CAMNT_0050530651 /DNA_START=38 /DNA_END=1554 /DNA_ORIENTATION=+